MRMTPATGCGAKRGRATPDHDRLSSIEAVVSEGEPTPPKKPGVLMGRYERHGGTRPAAHGRIAGAADRGFADPAPGSAQARRAIVALYRRHRDSLPEPRDATRNACPHRTAG